MSDVRDYFPNDDQGSFFDNSNDLSRNEEQGFISSDSTADAIFENCYLCQELSDYEDESLVLCRLMRNKWTYAQENKYLTELWEWEKSAIRPINDWFDHVPKFIDLQNATDQEVSYALCDVCTQLRKVNQKLLHVDHLSDRCLYELLINYVLPCEVKYLPHGGAICWDFGYFLERDHVAKRYNADFIWLTYYATDSERTDWLRSVGGELPPKKVPLYKREKYPFR